MEDRIYSGSIFVIGGCPIKISNEDLFNRKEFTIEEYSEFNDFIVSCINESEQVLVIQKKEKNSYKETITIFKDKITHISTKFSD